MMIWHHRRLGRPMFTFRRFAFLRRLRMGRILAITLPAVLGLSILAPSLLAATASTQPTNPVTADRARLAAKGQTIQQLREMIKSLDLSATQKTQVRDIIKNAATDIRAIRQNTASTQPADKLAQIRDRIQQARQEISQVLTPEQQAKVQAQMQTIKADMQAHRQEIGAALAKKVDAALATLNLTDAQKTHIQQLRSDIQTKVDALQANPKDTAARQALKTELQSAREQFQQILTPEQLKQLKEVKNPQN